MIAMWKRRKLSQKIAHQIQYPLKRQMNSPHHIILHLQVLLLDLSTKTIKVLATEALQAVKVGK